MFKRKIVKFSDKIPDNSLFLIVLIGVPIGLFFITKNIFVTLIIFAFLLFFYLRSGKIKPYDGEIIFIFGLPRSGKTSLLAKIAHDNYKRRRIVVNEELSHFYEKDAVIERNDIGKYQFGTPDVPAIILFDEISLDGFDNRDFKTNFKGEEGQQNLKGFKKSGHRYQSFVLANQGWNEVDSKIREGLTHSAYWVKNKGLYSVAIKLPKSFEIDSLTGEPRDTYTRPNFFMRLLDPSCYVYINHKKYGKLFDTHYDEGLPIFPYTAARDVGGAADRRKIKSNIVIDESQKQAAEEIINNLINVKENEK